MKTLKRQLIRIFIFALAAILTCTFYIPISKASADYPGYIQFNLDNENFNGKNFFDYCSKSNVKIQADGNIYFDFEDYKSDYYGGCTYRIEDISTYTHHETISSYGKAYAEYFDYSSTVGSLKLYDNSGNLIFNETLNPKPSTNHFNVRPTAGLKGNYTFVLTLIVEKTYMTYSNGETTHYYNYYDCIISKEICIDDNIAPTIIDSNGNNIDNNSVNYYNTSQNITISDEGLLDYVTCKKGNQTEVIEDKNHYSMSEETCYIIKAYDVFENCKTATFYIDKTAPTFNIPNNSFFNEAKKIVFYDEVSKIKEVYVYKNGVNILILDISSLKIGTDDNYYYNLSEEGEYTLVAYDNANNSSSITFAIDKTAPTVLDSSIETINNKYYINDSITFNFSEPIYFNSNLELIHNITLDTDYFINDGTYNFTLTDQAGNISSLAIVFDTIAPTFNILNNSFFNSESKKIHIYDDLSWIKEIYVYKDGENYSPEFNNLNTSDCTCTLEEEGEYTLIAYDNANNSSSITFAIDKTAPTCNINQQYYKQQFEIEIIDNILISSNSYLKLNDEIKYLSCSKEDYINTFGDGSYILYLIDQAGNTSTIHFVVDTIVPTLSFNGYEALNDNIYKINHYSLLTFSVSETSTIVFLEGNEYNSSSIKGSDLLDGIYEIKVVDLANNESIYYIDVKSSIPEATFEGYYSSKNKTYYVNSTSNLTITISEDNINVTIANDEIHEDYINAKSIIFNINQFQNPGIYTLFLYDSYGNNNEYYIELDITQDLNNYNDLKSKNYSWINHWFNTYNYSYSNQNYYISNYYSFATKEEAEAFAREREIATVDVIRYNNQTIFESEKYGNINSYYDFDYKDNVQVGDNVYIYKSNVTNNIVVYFNPSNYFNALNYFVSESISEYYKYFYNQENIKTPYNESLFYDVFCINESSYSLKKAETDTTIYISTDKINYISSGFNTIVLNNTTNYVKEIDKAGNITEYIVLLNVTPITYNVYNNSNYTSVLNNTLTLYTPQPITLIPKGYYTNNYIAKISYTNLSNETTIFYEHNNISINNEGIYTIYTYDIFGNKSSNYTIYYLDNKPAITFTINEVDKIVVDMNCSISYTKIVDNQITNILVKFTNESGQTSQLYTDGSGTEITAKTTFLTFVESGVYEIIITDIFGNEVRAAETLQKGTPFGQLFLADTSAISSGSITNQNIYFIFSSEYGYSCKCNDSNYISGTHITKEGSYIFILTNNDKSSTYSIIIDKTAPIGTFKVDNEPFNNNRTTSSHNVTFTWEEIDAIAYIQNSLIPNNYEITKEGTTIIKLIDEAGNTAEYKITLDYTAPIVNIYSGSMLIDSGAIVNKKIKFEWNESNCAATVNGSLYTSGKYFTNPGIYTLTISDRYGNVAMYSAELDLTEPEFQIFDENNVLLNQDAKINRGFYITWEDDNYLVYVNNSIYTKKTILSTAKDYIIEVINTAGTSVECIVSISYTVPTALIYDAKELPLKSGSITNRNFYLTWKDNKNNRFNCTYNGDNIYQNGYVIKTDGTYNFTLADQYGNTATYIVTKDTVSPIGELINVDNNGFTNKNVVFNYDEGIAFLNDLYYVSGTEIKKEGSHIIRLIDEAGNTAEYTFIIDKTAPTFNVSQELNDYGYANKRLSISWTESKCTAYLNDREYTSGKLIYDGTYEFKLIDQAGNTSTIHFVVDTIAPVIILLGVENNGKTNKAVSAYWNNTSYTVYLDGIIYNQNQEITAEGVHELKVVNLAGNSTIYTFEIDKTAPEAIFEGVEPGNITANNVYITWTESNCTAYLNDKEYSPNTPIKNEGTYKFTIYDYLQNSRTYTFEIDKTPPLFMIYSNNICIDANKAINSSFYVFWSELNVTATLNGEAYNSQTISEDGTYNFTLTDQYGNYVSFFVTIDSTLPEAILNGVSNHGQTKENVTITFNSDVTATLNGDIFNSGTTIKNEGFYTLVLKNKIGSSTTYTFEIDKTAPEIYLYGVNSKNYSRECVVITCDYNDATIYLNNEPYIPYTEISLEGNYLVKGVDAVGNSVEYTFIIDRTAPTFSITGLNEFNCSNKSVYITWEESNCAAYLNNDLYSSGVSISKADTYEFVLTDEAGNTAEYTFIIDKTAPEAIFEGLNNYNLSNSYVKIHFESNIIAFLGDEQYISGTEITKEGKYSLSLYDQAGNIADYSFEIDKTPPAATLNGVNDNGFTNKKIKVSSDETKLIIYVNGNKLEKDYITLANNEAYNNNYEVQIYDQAGNATTYHFIYKYIADLSTQYLIEVNETDTSARIIFNEGFQCFVNEKEIESNYEIVEPGTYDIKLSDQYGNTTTQKITIKSVRANNYAFNNISTIITITLISLLVIYVILKKANSVSKNPYKKKK